jgi:hypothetical protein
MLAESGVLEKDEDQMKYRWNPNYDWEKYGNGRYQGLIATSPADDKHTGSLEFWVFTIWIAVLGIQAT